MQRCRKPPIFAFAYISPARSSKRRITSIFSRTVRQMSLSGRSCFTFPNPICSSRLATSLGPSRAPSPVRVVSLVAIGSASTHCGSGSMTLTPEWGEAVVLAPGPALSRPRTRSTARLATCAASQAASAAPTPAVIRTRRSSVLLGGGARRHTHRKLRRGQGGSGLFEAVVAVEELVPDGDRRDAANAALVGLPGGLAQPLLDRLCRERLEHGVRMQLAGGGGDQHVVDVGEILAAGERLAEGREREGDRAADRSGEGGRAHRLERVGRPLLGPADRHELVVGGAPLDLGHAGVSAIRDGPGSPTRHLPDPPEQNRVPDRDGR